jgi:ribokinase
LNADLVVRAPRLPGRGETILGGPFRTFPGGKGANQAVAAARLGAAVSLVGCVGEDAHGAWLREMLAREEVDVSRVAVRAGVPTGVALITVEDSGENTILVAPGANATLAPRDVETCARAIEDADLVVLQLEVPLESVARAVEIARAAGRTVLLNAGPAQPLPESLLGSVDILVVNRGEAASLARAGSDAEPDELARRLATAGPRHVVLTLGDRGALLASGSRLLRQRAFAVRAVDAVGAGDAFVAALAVAWAEKLPPERALRWACAAGALATTMEGALPSLPRRSDVDRLA